MQRYLGLDIGDKTVGIALSDPLGYTAQPIETIRFQIPTESFQRLVQIITENSVTKIISGLPLNMNGTEGPQVQKVRDFLENFKNYMLKRNKTIEVELIDERLSTVAAERSLIEADISRAKRKKVIDKMAAVFILQGYLNTLAMKDL